MTHTLAFEIDYLNEKAGWINCWLSVDGERHHLDASYSFPPFLPLLRFVKSVAGQRFPAHFRWEEEGFGADFEATSVPGDSSLVHLKIKYEDGAPWLDDAIERAVVIEAFMPPIVDFSEGFERAELDWFTPRRQVTKIQRAIMAGFPLRTETHASQPVECLVQDGYDHNYLEGRVFFKIRFEEVEFASILLFDTHPFWPQVLDFIGDIASAALPAECEHLRIVSWNSENEPPEESRTLTRLVAEPVDVARSFRLKIFITSDDEAEYLLLDEVVDRRQFSQGFAASFKNLLNKRYRLIPDSSGATFDLRSLPLDRLGGSHDAQAGIIWFEDRAGR